jgi:hypothetical protein
MSAYKAFGLTRQVGAFSTGWRGVLVVMGRFLFGRDKTRERAMMSLFPIENFNDVLYCAAGWR